MDCFNNGLARCHAQDQDPHKDFQLRIEPCANTMERYYLRFWLRSAANPSPPSKFNSANWLSTKHPWCQSSQCGKPIQMGAILNWRMRLLSMNEEREKKKGVCFGFLFSHRSQWWPSRTLRELEAMTHRKVRKPICDVRNIFQNSTTCTFHNFAGF